MPETEQSRDFTNDDVWDYDAMMERMLHDHSIAETIIHLFLEDTPKELEKLGVAIEKKDAKEIRLRSHSIKGSASNVSGLAVKKTAEEIEKQAIQNDLKNVEHLYSSLKKQYSELSKKIKDYIQT